MSNLTEAQLEDIESRAKDAARIFGGLWDSALVAGGEEAGNYHAIISEEKNDFVARACDDSRESSWLCDYLESVSPAVVLELVKAARAAQDKPNYPEKLPCPVLLEPAMRFGKGVATRTVLKALQRRAEYYAELDAMTPEERAKHDANIEAFREMLSNPPAAPEDPE